MFRRLGVPGASELDAQELRKRYRRLARDHHPDLPGNDRAESTRILSDLNGAYALLAGRVQEQELGGWGPEPQEPEEAGRPRGGGGGFAFGYAAPGEEAAAQRAQMHFFQHGPPNLAFGFPLVVGGVHMPRHPTEEATFFDPLADLHPVRGGLIARTPGYAVLLVPPDVAPAFLAAGGGHATEQDWARVAAWCDEQGLDRLFRDLRPPRALHTSGAPRRLS